MKKKFMAVVLSMALAVTALSGCGKKSEKNEKDKADETDYAAMSVEDLQKEILKDVEDYVTIKDYNNIEVEVAPVAEVTDGAVETELQSWLDFYPLVFEGACASGDSVNIDYVGTVNGEEFEGGSYEGYDLELGSGTFIPGFEDQVQGMTVGETKDINVKFPDDYTSEEMAGKDAVFKVTLNYYKKTEGSGTLTDKWVEVVVDREDISDKVSDLTVDGFKAFVKSTLEDDAKTDYDSAVAQAILGKVKELANYDKVPDKLRDEFIDNEREYQESYISNQYGMEIADYLEAVSIDEDTFQKDIEESAVDYMEDVLAVKLIGIKEDIKVSQKDYDEYLQTYADYYNAESLDAFKDQYASEYGTDLFESLYLEKVLEHLKEKVKITENPNLTNKDSDSEASSGAVDAEE